MMAGAKLKIFFLIPSLYSGGAERVFLSLVRSFSREKFEITLVILTHQESHYHALIPSDIEVIQYYYKNTWKAAREIYRLINNRNPEIVFSTLSHLNVIMACIKMFTRKKILFVARESNTLSQSHRHEKFPFIFNLLLRTVYHRLDLIICQSAFMANDLMVNYACDSERIVVIHNPVDFDHTGNGNGETENQGKPENVVRLLSIGRLTHQKRIDRLLQIASMLKNFPYKLRILGDGIMRDQLLQLRKKLHLEDTVEFLGISDDPFSHLHDTDCLLLTSCYEGLPNVVLEAHSCGVPVIAFDSTGGVREIIDQDFNGWLVPDGDINTFAALIRSRYYLQVNKEAIRNRTYQKFNLSRIARQYEDILLKKWGSL